MSLIINRKGNGETFAKKADVVALHGVALELISLNPTLEQGIREHVLFAAHSPEALARHMLSWDVDELSELVLEELYREGKWVHDTLLGANIFYEERIPKGNIRLVYDDHRSNTPPIIISELHTDFLEAE